MGHEQQFEAPELGVRKPVFALLGLRALSFLVTGLLDRLVYLSTGLSLILAFIGVKLAVNWGHLHSDKVPEISATTSLLVIAVVLTVTTIASLVRCAATQRRARTPAPCARTHPAAARAPRRRHEIRPSATPSPSRAVREAWPW